MFTVFQYYHLNNSLGGCSCYIRGVLIAAIKHLFQKEFCRESIFLQKGWEHWQAFQWFSSPVPVPLACTFGKKITQPLELLFSSACPRQGGGFPQTLVVGEDRVGSEECASRGVKTEVAPTDALLSDIQALLRLHFL